MEGDPGKRLQLIKDDLRRHINRLRETADDLERNFDQVATARLHGDYDKYHNLEAKLQNPEQ